MSHIKDFQIANGLAATGTIDKPTCDKMRLRWGLSVPQLANCLGQCYHETGGFTADTENLNYSATGLWNTFKKYFASPDDAAKYARQPEKIANHVYANRMGNGPEASGDGWKFRGRGALQITGRQNYAAFEKFLKLPAGAIMNNPDSVASNYFWETALYYFTVNKLWPLSKDVSDATILGLSRAINLGNWNSKSTPNGLNDRAKWSKYYFGLAN